MAPEPVDRPNHNENTFNESDIQNSINMIPIESSSEEEETITFENGGYQPLSQNPDNIEDDELVDYNSLSGLMGALNTHGPNIIDSMDHFEEVESVDNLKEEKETLEADSEQSDSVQKILQQSGKEREDRYLREQSNLWSSCTRSNEIPIDENKETEIKRVMSRIRIPNMAIPSWAKEISDEEWKNQISSRIFGYKGDEDK